VSPAASTAVVLDVHDPLIVASDDVTNPAANRAIGLTFDRALSGAPAAAAFTLFKGDSGQQAASSNRQKISVRHVTYDAGTTSISIRTGQKLKSNRFYVLKGDSAQITDAFNFPLDGASNGTAGSAYVLRFGRGKKLTYIDSEGNKVKLKLTGGGRFVLTRDTDGEGQTLTIVGATAKTRLTGSVRPTRLGGDGTTTLASVSGIGAGTNDLDTDQFIF